MTELEDYNRRTGQSIRVLRTEPCVYFWVWDYWHILEITMIDIWQSKQME